MSEPADDPSGNDEALPPQDVDVAKDSWEAIGHALGEARRNRRVSKREAARLVGVSEASWRAYEAGGRNVYGKWVLPNPDELTLGRIADEFGVMIVHNTGDPWDEWEFSVREPTPIASEPPPVPYGAAAASGEPSHLTGIMSDLVTVMNDVREELRLIRRQRQGDADVESVEGGGQGA